MVSLVRAASCLFIPFTVAAVGGGALAEDASNLIQAHVALAPTANGTGDSQVLHSLLVTAWADLAAQAAQVQLASGASAARTVALSANQLRMHEAARYLQDAVAKASAARRKEPACGATCILAIATDLLFIAQETALQLSGKSDQLCTIGTLVVWWTTGLIALTEDNQLPLSEALHMLAQQVTSVGYGSSGPKDSFGLKMFHGLSSVLSQMSVGRVTGEITAKVLDGTLHFGDSLLSHTAALLLTVAASTLLFAADLKEGNSKYATYGSALMDALYEAMMTMTTIGYGDLSPSTETGKFMTPLGLPLLTNAFAGFTGELGPPTPPGPEPASELCMCNGVNWCEMVTNQVTAMKEKATGHH